MYKKIFLLLIVLISGAECSGKPLNGLQRAQIARKEAETQVPISYYAKSTPQDDLEKQIRDEHAARPGSAQKAAAVRAIISGGVALASGAAFMLSSYVEGGVHDCRALKNDPFYQNSGKICIASLIATGYFLNKIRLINKSEKQTKK